MNVPRTDSARDEQEAPKRKSLISKIDITLLVVLWVITGWGVVAERLSSDDNLYMSDSAKFYISISIPLSTSAAAIIKSIQVGMEIKSDRIAAREAREVPNINADTVIIEQPRTESRRCSRHHSDEIEHNLGERGSGMPKRPNKNIIGNLDEYTRRQCYSLPTLKLGKVESHSTLTHNYVDDSYHDSISSTDAYTMSDEL